MHNPSTIALTGPLAGTLANAGFSAQAYLSDQIFGRRVAMGNGSVSAALALADNSIIRGDGGAAGIQSSGAYVDDNSALIVNNPTSVTLTVNGTAFAAQLQAHGNSTSLTTNNGYGSWSNWSNNTVGPILLITKSRSASVGGQTIVQNNDNLGIINFYGSDGTDFEGAASIHGEVDGTPGNNDMPGRLSFYTTPDGTASLTFAGAFKNTGNFILTSVATAETTIGVTGKLQVNGLTAATSQAQFSAFANDATTAGTLALSKSRATIVGNTTIVQSGDVVGRITGYGANSSSAYDGLARISFEVDGTPGSSGDMPGRTVFLTTPDGSATLSEAARINNQQEILVGVTTRNASGGKLQIKAGGQTTNNANVGGTTYVNTTQTGNTAATETDAFSHTIAASTLATNGDSLEFYAAGTFATTASTDKQVKVKFGAATLFDTGALAIVAASDWSLWGRIIRTGAATQKALVTLTTSNAALVSSTDYTTPTETLSGAVTMKLTVNGTNANDTVAELYKETWAAAA